MTTTRQEGWVCWRVALTLVFATGLIACSDEPNDPPKEQPAAEQTADTKPAEGVSKKSAGGQTAPPPEPKVVEKPKPPETKEIGRLRKSFEFKDETTTRTYFIWNKPHAWSFSKNKFSCKKTNGDTRIVPRIGFVGDFTYRFTAFISHTYTNAKKPKLLINKESIQLLKTWKQANLDVTVHRVGNKVVVIVNDHPPQVVELTEAQLTDPVEVRFVTYSRAMTMKTASIDAAHAVVMRDHEELFVPRQASDAPAYVSYVIPTPTVEGEAVEKAVDAANGAMGAPAENDEPTTQPAE